jgi:predicted phage terminase large subunit-like protein
MNLQTNSLPKLQQALAAQELLRRRKARSNLLDFTRYTYPEYQVNWHHEVLCRYLDQFVSGAIKRLMVFMPPQHGKSELVSRRLPAYIFGKQPDASIIATSYSSDLANRMNRDVQRIMDGDEYRRLFPDSSLFGINIRTVAQSTYLRNSDIFEIVGHKGVYRSAGRGGGITGMGFNYGIIDDPLKDRAEAQSVTIRDNLWDWYISTFYTRQRKDASILITQTRWHVDDLAGRAVLAMEDPNGDQWVIISFPAIAEKVRHPDDPREIGEPLWADRYPLEFLTKVQSHGDYEWQSLYQQRPIAEGGGHFKRDKFNIIEDEPPDIVRRARFWDLALSEKTSADYTVGVEMGITKTGSIVVLDVRRFQVEWDDVVSKIAAVAAQDTRDVEIGIETAFFQTRAVKKLLQRPELHAYTIRGYKPDGDKLTRALPLVSRVGEGMVYVLRRAWTDNYLSELCTFTGVGDKHDDQVDASSGAYLMLDARKPITVSYRKYA